MRRILGYDLRSLRRNCGGGVLVRLPLPVAPGHAPNFSTRVTGKYAQPFPAVSTVTRPLWGNDWLGVSAHSKDACNASGYTTDTMPSLHDCGGSTSILPVGRSGAVCMRETRATGSYSMLRNGYVPVESGLPQGIRLTKRKQASRAKTRRESVSL